MSEGRIDCIVTPAQHNLIPPGANVCADNGCFGRGYPGDLAWWRWLSDLPRERLQFAVAPDVVADAEATLARSTPWLSRIRELGIPVAFVAQDGLERLSVPWDAFDVLFLGGSTEWKLGEHAQALTRDAKTRQKWVHMGRVNSAIRFRHAWLSGCDSADGTFLSYGPDVNLPIVEGWMRDRKQAALWE